MTDLQEVGVWIGSNWLWIGNEFSGSIKCVEFLDYLQTGRTVLREVGKKQYLEKPLGRPRLQYLKHVAKNTGSNSYKGNKKWQPTHQKWKNKT